LKRLAFLPFLFLLSCFSLSSNYSDIRVSKVIDGDTIILENGKHLRLIGIDTPEVKKYVSGKFEYSPQPFSLEAKEFVNNLIGGKRIRVEFDIDRKDKYNRLLGYCFFNNGGKSIFVNEQLLKEGLAVLYTYPPNIKYVDKFISAQKYARLSKKGIWGSYLLIPPDRAENFIGQIRAVRGRVLSSYKSEKILLLNFGADYKTDFTVVIFKDSWPYFLNRGIDPETFYKGKIVEVTGRVREYNGPEIIVNYPAEIRVIE